MLTYNDIVKKSFRKVLKNKNVIINTLLVFIPVFIGIIVNAIVLYKLNQELALIVEEYSLLMFDSMTNEEQILSGYFDKILMTFAQNGQSITISIIVTVSTYLITGILEFVIYYAVHCSIEKEEFSIKESFKLFAYTFPLVLYKNVLIFLWSLLFIIPGIYKSIEYSLCYGIKLENITLSSKECIKRSKELMKGRKERMFIQILYTSLFMILVNFVISAVFSILSIFPFISLITSDMTNAVSSAVGVIFNFAIIAIFYQEIKFDEKVLEENTELKEKGVTVIVRPDPDRKVRVFYSNVNPYNNQNYNNYNNQSYNPYKNESFSRSDINSQKSNEDPFEKAERESKKDEENKWKP